MQRLKKHTTRVPFFLKLLKDVLKLIERWGEKRSMEKLWQEKTNGETQTVKEKYANIVLIIMDYHITQIFNFRFSIMLHDI